MATKNTVKHFLSLLDVTSEELLHLIHRACELKADKTLLGGVPLQGQVMAMIFESASTRTRLASETAMAQLGGSTIFLALNDSQMSRGETIADTAKVMSSMVQIILMRSKSHNSLVRVAEASKVPVINALSDRFHPCQLLADLQTFFELKGDIQGRRVAWLGEGNNVCQTYIQAAMQLDFELYIACPEGYEPPQDLLEQAGKHVSISRKPKEAVREADLVVTDVWLSMNQEKRAKVNYANRKADFKGFQLNHEIMDCAARGALAMHCLPAHRGEEISAELLDDENSVIWQEAENRLYTHKALFEWLLIA